MSYAEMILQEFDHEMANTRLVLECVPDDKLDWQAHSSMNTIGWNVNHLVEIPGWVEGTLTQTSWDIAPVDGEPYQTPSRPSMRLSSPERHRSPRNVWPIVKHRLRRYNFTSPKHQRVSHWDRRLEYAVSCTVNL